MPNCFDDRLLVSVDLLASLTLAWYTWSTGVGATGRGSDLGGRTV